MFRETQMQRMHNSEIRISRSEVGHARPHSHQSSTRRKPVETHTTKNSTTETTEVETTDG